MRSKMKLTKARAVKAPAAKGKAAASKGAKARAIPKVARSVSGRAKGPNKTAFVKGLLGRDGTLNAKAVNRAWTEAGNVGSISANLVSKTRADLGIKDWKTASKAKATVESPSAASRAEVRHSNGHPSAPSIAHRTSSLLGGGHDRELHEIEGEIDELIFRLRGLGGYADVQEALREPDGCSSAATKRESLPRRQGCSLGGVDANLVSLIHVHPGWASRLDEPTRNRGGVSCDANSTNCPAFEVMSKRRRGYPERSQGQAGPPGRPRRQGTLREARPQRPVPLRQRPAVQEVLPAHGLVSTG